MFSRCFLSVYFVFFESWKLLPLYQPLLIHFISFFVPRVTSNREEVRFGKLLSWNRFMCCYEKLDFSQPERRIALLCSYVWWIHTLTSMNNVLVPNIAKRAGKRVPSPHNITNNQIKLRTLWTWEIMNLVCATKGELYGSRSWSH